MSKNNNNIIPGYTFFFINEKDNTCYCSGKCYDTNNDNQNSQKIEVNYENDNLYCDVCSKKIESSYGEE